MFAIYSSIFVVPIVKTLVVEMPFKLILFLKSIKELFFKLLIFIKLTSVPVSNMNLVQLFINLSENPDDCTSRVLFGLKLLIEEYGK